MLKTLNSPWNGSGSKIGVVRNQTPAGVTERWPDMDESKRRREAIEKYSLLITTDGMRGIVLKVSGKRDENMAISRYTDNCNSDEAGSGYAS